MMSKLKNIRCLIFGLLFTSLMIGCSNSNDNYSNNHKPATGAEYYINKKVEDVRGQYLIVESCMISDIYYIVHCDMKFYEYDLVWVDCHSDLGEKERTSLLKMELNFEKTGSTNDIDPYDKFAFEGGFDFIFSPDHTPIIGEKLCIDFAIVDRGDDFGYFIIEVGE